MLLFCYLLLNSEFIELLKNIEEEMTNLHDKMEANDDYYNLYINGDPEELYPFLNEFMYQLNQKKRARESNHD